MISFLSRCLFTVDHNFLNSSIFFLFFYKIKIYIFKLFEQTFLDILIWVNHKFVTENIIHISSKILTSCCNNELSFLYPVKYPIERKRSRGPSAGDTNSVIYRFTLRSIASLIAISSQCIITLQSTMAGLN